MGTLGVVLVLLALFVVGPILLFGVGALWSALMSLMMSENAEAEHPLPGT